MFLAEFFGYFSLSALVTWAFLMAFFFNLFVYSLGVKRETTLLFSSFIMMASYTATDYFLLGYLTIIRHILIGHYMILLLFYLL